MNSYKELPNRASQAQQTQYAGGIAEVNSVVERLHAEGRLPEVFAPESSKLHPSLEGKVRIETLAIGGKSKEEILREFGRNHINTGFYARSMVESVDFTTLQNPQPKELVIVRVGDLVSNPKGPYATTKEIWAARDEKGLEPVPAETAFHYLLQKGGQLQLRDVIWMSMKTIADFYGDPYVFGVNRGSAGLWLNSYLTMPSSEWNPESRFAFGS